MKAKQVWIVLNGAPVAGVVEGVADAKTGRVRVLVPTGQARVPREHMKEPEHIYPSRLKALGYVLGRARKEREDAARDALASAKYHEREERKHGRAYFAAQKAFVRESNRVAK